MVKICLFHLPLFLYVLLIFILSSISDIKLPAPPDFDLIDKVYHALEYAMLGFLIGRSFSRITLRWRFPFFWIWLFGVLYGLSDEIHQYFVPGRFCDWTDLLADSAGVALGILLWRLFFRVRQRRTISC